MSLRIRLTLWYVVTLTLILLAFSGLVYWQTQRSLLKQMDDALHLAASQALASIDTTNEPAFTDVPILLNALDQIENNLTLQLISSDGTIFESLSNDGENEAEQGGELEIFPPVLPSHETLTLHVADHSWRVYSEPANGDVWLQVGQAMDTLEDNLSNLLLQMAWGLPLAVLIAGVGGYVLASGALRPVDAMTRTAQSISGHDLSQRIGYTGVPDEIGRLATTFDTMLDRLDDAFERERRFTSDAAHELRTPLTALKGQIDVTLSQPRSAESYRSTLSTMNTQVDRLINLTKDLLFMTRLDQGQLIDERETIDLQDFLPTIVDFVRPLAAEKALALVENVLPLTVYANPDLLIQCLLNLLDNAIKYANEGGTVTVQASEIDEGVAIAIIDTGVGISAEHIPHLFDRFYRIDESRSRSTDDNGSGLGLAITNKIVQAHGGTLIVESVVGEGTTCTIVLPSDPQ